MLSTLDTKQHQTLTPLPIVADNSNVPAVVTPANDDQAFAEGLTAIASIDLAANDVTTKETLEQRRSFISFVKKAEEMKQSLFDYADDTTSDQLHFYMNRLVDPYCDDAIALKKAFLNIDIVAKCTFFRYAGPHDGDDDVEEGHKKYFKGARSDDVTGVAVFLKDRSPELSSAHTQQPKGVIRRLIDRVRGNTNEEEAVADPKVDTRTIMTRIKKAHEAIINAAPQINGLNIGDEQLEGLALAVNRIKTILTTQDLHRTDFTPLSNAAEHLDIEAANFQETLRQQAIRGIDNIELRGLEDNFTRVVTRVNKKADHATELLKTRLEVNGEIHGLRLTHDA